jgi:crossover junction endonuclease MUS81
MNIVIDQRENAMKEILNKQDIDLVQCIEYIQLNIGDIVIKDGDDVVCIFERKTCDDLLASIKDGRYREQKWRLLEHFNCDTIVYLIEGVCKDVSKSKLIDNCIINTLFRDKIKVIRSRDVENTVEILLDIYKKFKTKKFQQTKGAYSEMVKSVKKTNLTEDIWFITCLKGIPGVSEKTAQCIIKEFSSMKELINGFELNGGNLLEKIKVGNRCLGKKTSEKIYNYVCK